jgi:c-di-GMP-binding flagellar brake protein YcgR
MVDDNNLGSELAMQDRVLVEADVAGHGVAFRTMIVKVCADELWLGLASPDRRVEQISQQQQLRLTVARTGCALVGESTFLRPLGGGKSRVFAVARPRTLGRVQRRAHIRYQTDVPISFRRLDPTTREPRGQGGTAMTVNVSSGGLLFNTDLPFTVGDVIDVTLALSGMDRVAVTAQATRIIGPPAGVDLPAGTAPTSEIAVKFTRITAVDQDRVVRFLLLKEHRRQEAAAAEPVPGFAQIPAAPAPAPPVPAAAMSARSVAAPVSPRPPLPAAVAAARAPRPVELPQLDPSLPPIEVGLRLCESGKAHVRQWFDSLMPFDRIELLSQVQANMAGGSVPGATEPTSVRPLAVALGLLAA